MVLFFDWESVEQARKFMNSDDLRKAMQQAGVEGAPDVQYIEDVAYGPSQRRPTSAPAV